MKKIYIPKKKKKISPLVYRKKSPGYSQVRLRPFLLVEKTDPALVSANKTKTFLH